MQRRMEMFFSIFSFFQKGIFRVSLKKQCELFRVQTSLHTFVRTILKSVFTYYSPISDYKSRSHFLYFFFLQWEQKNIRLFKNAVDLVSRVVFQLRPHPYYIHLEFLKLHHLKAIFQLGNIVVSLPADDHRETPGMFCALIFCSN